ncbi:hypothetical protein LEMLEM_LOCUS9896 [Lemmus lemmus]
MLGTKGVALMGPLENASNSELVAAQCSDSTVSEVTLVEATEEGPGGGKAVAEAAALAGGSQAEGPSRGRPGLRVQGAETVDEESTEQGQCGHCCQPVGAGPA